jgi:hypothetical protein
LGKEPSAKVILSLGLTITLRTALGIAVVCSWGRRLRLAVLVAFGVKRQQHRPEADIRSADQSATWLWGGAGLLRQHGLKNDVAGSTWLAVAGRFDRQSGNMWKRSQMQVNPFGERYQALRHPL